MMNCIYGVDVGGTTVKLGLFSDGGDLLEKWEIPTRTQEQGKHILPDIAASIAEKTAQRGIQWEQVLGLGIGVPGPVDGTGTVYGCVNLGWGRVDLKKSLGSLLPGISNFAVANDANAAALGELWQGGGKGYDSAVLFALGTGVGGGVVLGGRILAGAHGGSGEVGHITVEPEEGELCSCGKRGCLEQYASAGGMVRLGRRLLAQSDVPSALRGMDAFSAKDICDLARAGEETACRIVDRWAAYLGRAMSFVANTVDPEVLLIGGGMSRAGSVLTDAVERHYKTFAFSSCVQTPIVTARLGNDAGLYGCAKLILG